MVLTVRLDHDYESLFNELKDQIINMGERPLGIIPTNTQIVKAMLIYIAKNAGINVDHMEV